MSINLINPPKSDKMHKTYFFTQTVINNLEMLKSRTNSEDYNELVEKMIGLTKSELKKQKAEGVQ